MPSTALGVYPLAVICGAGSVLAGIRWLSVNKAEHPWALARLLLLVALVVGAASILGQHGAGRIPFTDSALFGFFLKVGSVLYGSGYVLLSYLNTDLVSKWGWLTRTQLLDAVAVGQFTPGPVFTTATFIGFLLDGPWGAVAATVGIFLPSFVFVALSGRILLNLRKSLVAGAFLDGVNVGSPAIMAVVTVELGCSALIDALAACHPQRTQTPAVRREI